MIFFLFFFFYTKKLCLWCYYPNRLRELVSLVCRIFLNVRFQNIFYKIDFLVRKTHGKYLLQKLFRAAKSKLPILIFFYTKEFILYYSGICLPAWSSRNCNQPYCILYYALLLPSSSCNHAHAQQPVGHLQNYLIIYFITNHLCRLVRKSQY